MTFKRSHSLLEQSTPAMKLCRVRPGLTFSLPFANNLG
jgi:hypothetical protein